jgi:hypothetical protein
MSTIREGGDMVYEWIDEHSGRALLTVSGGSGDSDEDCAFREVARLAGRVRELEAALNEALRRSGRLGGALEEQFSDLEDVLARNAALKEENRRLIAALEEAEYCPHYDPVFHCPICGEQEGGDHSDACALGRVLHPTATSGSGTPEGE